MPCSPSKRSTHMAGGMNPTMSGHHPPVKHRKPPVRLCPLCPADSPGPIYGLTPFGGEAGLKNPTNVEIGTRAGTGSAKCFCQRVSSLCAQPTLRSIHLAMESLAAGAISFDPRARTDVACLWSQPRKVAYSERVIFGS